MDSENLSAFREYFDSLNTFPLPKPKMPFHRQRGGGNRGRRQYQQSSSLARVCKPPMIKTNVLLKHKFRYICLSSISGMTITALRLANACGVMGTVVNSTVSNLYDSVKIRSIEMWGPPPSQGAAATVTCLWNQLAAGVSNMSTLEFCDTSNSTAVPAHIKTHPPKETFASFWQPSSGTSINLCALSAPAGTMIDVEVELILSDTGASNSATTVTTCLLGAVYYLPLDGTAGHQVPPVQLNSTF
jgi:hypothetical protein